MLSMPLRVSVGPMSSSSSQPTITISIITPCYNGRAFLGDTLRSAVKQSRLPIEILVVDDGSTDDSAAIAARFGGPVRVISQKNQGESVARNRGLAEAAGSHVLFLDADDIIAPESLARLAVALDGAGPTAVAIMGCAWFESDPDVPYQMLEASRRQFYPEIIESNFAPPHCWLVPRELVRAAGGFCETLRWFEDWDLWWRVGLHAETLIPVGYVGARYRRHAGSQLATTSLADRARGHATLMSRMAQAFLERPAMLEAYGEQLFWSCWTALTKARAEGVSWPELDALSGGLREVARRGPKALRASRVAQSVKWLGPRAASALRRS
jgi:GT2 family glycosyltransferase